MTKISIITVVYNGDKTLGDTFRSIQSQRDIDLEYLVIDGASTDNTSQIIKDQMDHINVLVSEPDNGIYDAMNKGLKLATGEIIGFLNADDVYQGDDVLNKVMKIFEENAHIDLVYGDLVYVKTNDLTKTVRYWKSKEYSAKFFADGLVPPHPSFFVRKKAYDLVGNFNLQFRFAADYEIMFRLLKIYNRVSFYLPEVLVRMRLGGTTNNSVSNVLKGNIEIRKAWLLHKQPIPRSFWVKRNMLKIFQFIKKNHRN